MLFSNIINKTVTHSRTLNLTDKCKFTTEKFDLFELIRETAMSLSMLAADSKDVIPLPASVKHIFIDGSITLIQLGRLFNAS